MVEGIKTPSMLFDSQIKSRPQIYDLKILDRLGKVDFENFITAKAPHRQTFQHLVFMF